jgi:hypothetical protein
MNNEEIFNKLSDGKHITETIKITKIIADLYDIKYNAAKTIEAKEEYDYERQWWSECTTNLCTLSNTINKEQL